MDKNDVVSTLRLNGLHAEAEYVLKLQAQRKEQLDALRELEGVASFIPVDDRRERRQLGDALEKARAAIANAEG